MIDPQAASILAAVNRDPPLDTFGVEGARRLAAARPKPEESALASVEDLMVGPRPVPVRLYRPQRDVALPAIVFAHGGGWILGSVESADETCRRLAKASGCIVVSVEYRLAPEARHPAAVEDVLDVLEWLPAAGGLGIDPIRVAIAGESSGAQIVLEAALSGRPATGALRAQLLVCPPLDRRMASRSWAELGDQYIPRRSQMAWMWNLYLGERDEFAAGAADPLSSDPAHLPPTVLVVAQYDPLRDEALKFAEKLRRAGVPLEVIDCAGQIHPVFGYAPSVEACDRYLTQAGAAVGALLGEKC